MVSSKGTVKILAIDDSDAFLAVYRNIFQSASQNSESSYEVKSANCGSEGLELFEQYQPDIVILDIHLPDMTGFDLYKEIRRTSSQRSYVGIIFVSAHASPEQSVQCLELGADDFCSKGNTQIELKARIQSVIRKKNYIDSLKLSNEKLREANHRLAKISITDELTGLHNMRYFKKRLNQEFFRSKRYDKYLSIMMFDIDNFKAVNDSTHHLMGSHVLSKIGHIVAETIRTVDIAARFGGDEYVIMMPETGPDGAYAAGKRISERIHHTTFNNGEFKVQVSLSVGVATYGPGREDFDNGTELMRQADLYLFEAKRKGKAQVVDLDRSDVKTEEAKPSTQS
jgi:diguanylate cyclase (GGDEF)-like protein